ncbi:MAG: tail fiber protein [Saprospiraceae bacterium]|nr:tail fiber protein [Saprospiraceae bacterium]
MRMINGATIIYGTILDSVFLAGFTTITVLWDTGAILVGTNVAELGAAVAGAPISPSSVAPQPTKMLGEIFTFAGVAGPAEVGAVYEACDGQVKDAALDPTYIPLYNIIGNVYGGSDQTNFQLPDTRGRSLMGEGTGAGLTARNLGDQPGEESHLLTAAEAAQKAITSGWGSIPTNYSVAGFSATGGGSGPQSNSHLVQQMPAIPGLNASSAHNVIHPALVMHFYIRTK